MRKLTAIGIGLAVGTFGFTALAEDAPKAAPADSSGASASSDGLKISAAALVGYGLGKDPNVYGLGLGLRAGVNVAGNIYLGGTFVYHLGKSVDSGPVTIKYGVQYYGVEAGYDIAAGPATLRPYVGLGFASAHATVCYSGACGSASGDSKLYVAPGAALLFGDKVFGGVDVRYVLVTGTGGSDASALGVFGTIGYKF